MPGSRAAFDIRPLRPADAAAARSLVAAEVRGTPYGETPEAALAQALENPSDEYRAIVAAVGDDVIGVMLYGQVAGTEGAARAYLVAVTASARLRGVASALIDAARHDLERRGARFIFVEFPDDPVLAAGRFLLERAGFREAARVRDYFREGIDLILLRRDVAGPGSPG